MESPEDKDLNFFERLTFSWVNSIISVGNERNLTMDDIYLNSKEDISNIQYKKFKNSTKKVLSKGSYNIWISLYLMVRSKLPFIFLFSLILIILSFLPSFILMLLLKSLKSDSNYGYFLVILLFITPVIHSFVDHQFSAFMGRISLHVESSLQTTIYRKLLKLDLNSRKVKTGEILSLLGTDAFKIGRFAGKFYYLWQCPLMIIISYSLLYYFCGNDAFIGFFALIILFPISLYSGNIYSWFVEGFMKVRDERIKLMTEILLGIKLIKFYSWESKFTREISDIRERELSMAFKTALMEVVQNITTKIISLSGIIFTFSLFALGGGELDLSRIFTNLSLFHVLETPLIQLTDLFSEVTNAYISGNRITNFLTLDNNVYKVDTSILKDENEIISIQNASFDYGNGKDILNDITLSFKRNSLNMIIGPVASGKSSLLLAILGELKPNKGTVIVNGDIAFCNQTPWITSGTIKDNILFGKPFNKEEYEKVIKMCQLEKDFTDMKNGDLTVIDELGGNLSGGQKHRISLARSCYSGNEILLIDSSLSALDSTVSTAVFHDCIKKISKTKTVILVTHSIQFLKEADQVIGLDKGKIVSKIEENNVTISTQIETKQKEKIEKKKVIDEEESKEGISFSDYYDYFSQFGYLFFFCIFALIMTSLLRISIGGWLSIWSDNKYHLTRKQYAYIFLIIGLLNVLIIPIQRISFVIGGIRSSRNFHYHMLISVLKSPITFFEKTSIGKILNRFSEDLYRVDYQLLYIFQIFLGYITNSITTLIMIIIIVPISIFFIVPVGLAYFYIFYYVRKPYLSVKKYIETSRAPVVSNFSNTITGIETIRAYKAEKRFIRLNDELIDYHQRSRWIEVILNRWISLRMEILSSFIIFGSSLLMYLFRKSIDPALCALAITYSLTISENFNWALRFFILAESAMINSQRLSEYCRLPTENYKGNIRTPELWPKNGKIDFKEFKFRYNQNQEYILKGISATIEPRESIGLVGRTGSGKSTIFSCLLRLFDISKDQIFIDGIDISQVGLKKLRRKISIIPQEPYLFSGTIRSNVDPKNKYTDYQIWNALGDVNLKDKIENLSQKLLEPIHEGGKNFSIGEKQLLCFARVILSDNKIILLDEATANVDQETEKIIHQTIQKVFREKTVLMIAHREHTLVDCHRIMVLENGKIVKFDSNYFKKM